MDWLASLHFEDPAATATFIDYLSAIEGLEQRRGALDLTIAELAEQGSHAETIARLRCFRGIETLTAAGLCAEIGDFRRFAKPAQLAGYLGITPSEWTSGEQRRQGSITKAGSKARPPPARRGGPPLRPPPQGGHRAPPPPGGPGSPRLPDHLAGTTPASPALVPPADQTGKARRQGGGRLRPRADLLHLGGRSDRLNRTYRHDPSALPGRHEQLEGQNPRAEACDGAMGSRFGGRARC